MGDGKELKNGKLSKNLKLKKVFFYGFIPLNKIEKFYIKCDLFISPSFFKQETFEEFGLKQWQNASPL